MSGRPPTPTALKVVTGNPGNRPLNKQEPDPDYLQDLTPPAWLAPAAAAVWSEIAPQLVRARLLTEIDVEPLAMGCVAIAQYRAAVARCGDELVRGKEAKDEGGKASLTGEYFNPWLLVQSMAFKQAMQIFAQFGMSPAARTRIALQPQGDLFGGKENPAARYFR